MADIRSAAGEGSERSEEPRVPNRDQPAQELAKVTDSGAKGKGFWRRRRRKNTSSSSTPPPAEPTPTAAPAPEAEAQSADPERTAAAQPGVEATADGAAKPAAGAAADRAAEAGAESGDADGADSAPEAEASTSGADESITEETPTDEGATDEGATDKGATDKGAADEGPAGEGTADDGVPAEGDGSAGSAAEDTEVVAEEAGQPDAPDVEEQPTSAVGVVYEPEESPDGFPLEYGNIIIGLPKPAASEDSSPPEDEAQDPADAVAAPTTAAPEEPADESKQHEDEQSDEPADVPEQVSSEHPANDVEEQPEPAPPSATAAAEAEQPAGEEETAEQAASEQAAEAASGQAVEQAASGQADGETEQRPPEQSAEEVPEQAAADSSPVATEGEMEQLQAEEPADESEHRDGAAAEAVAGEAEQDDAEPAEGASSDAAEAGEPGREGASADGAGSEDAEATAERVAEAELTAEESEGGPAAADEAGAAEVEAAAEELEDGSATAEEVAEPSAEELAQRVAAEQAAMALITALMRLRGALAASQLPIDVVGADEARQQQKSMLDQLDDYILPRLVQLEAPVLAVVGGSTGAGKSTLVNTMIGKVVSEPGVLRPTTRSPVLIHHPADADWFVGDRVLPGMARSSGDSPGGTEDPGQLRLVAADTVPQGLAILDAPDIDSVVEANRELATQLLAAADLWLFVTTAARYADAVPWDFLQSASDRSTAVAVVLDRAPSDTIDDITGHLAQMLLERGLGDSPLFSIKETVVDGNGMLPQESVASIKDWLVDLAADAEARSAVVRRTLHGAVTAMVKKTPPFAAAVRAQADTVAELRSTAETAYERAVKDVAKATQDGTLLRGEVLARWQEFVGTGELLKGLQTNVGRLRDKMKNAVAGKPPPTRDLNDAVESGLESLLREHAEAAAERAEESWQSTAAGRQLLAAGDRDLGRMSKDFPAAAGRAVRDWQGFVLDLVRKEGADKRSTARVLAYGVNGLGLSLMVVIFASTAGITGGEVGVGAGTAVVGQKLLEAVFGDQAVRTLVAKAREDLDGRVHALMDAEFARYLAVLDQHPVDPEAARQLTEAARAVEDCT